MAIQAANRSGTSLLSGDEALAFPLLDLLRPDRSVHEYGQRLNGQRRAFSTLCGGCYAQLFNGHPCELEFAPFEWSLPTQTPMAEAEGWVWLQAEGRREPNGRKQQALLAIAAPVLYRLAVLFFGGVPLSSDQEVAKRTPTDTEIRLLQRLFQHQLDICSDLLNEPETRWVVGPSSAEQLPRQGEWLVSEATMMVGEHASQWFLWWPCTPEEAEKPALELSAALEQALTTVPLRLRVVMQQWAMNLAEVSELQVGDVLPLEMSEPVVAAIGPRGCFRGQVAEHQGHLVFQVTDV